jgi:rhodanese-related sulfurtransferase
MPITTLTPDAAKRALAAGATLVDIRDADEHARERIPGAVNIPLARIEEVSATTGPIIYHCRSGMRTEANAATLAEAAGDRPCQILGGGLEAWRAAGHQTSIDRKQPIEVIRQVQLIAGSLVLIGAILAATVSPAFVALPAFVGAGLMVAGATGWCGMARLLHLMPWNRRSPAA